jgi:hypothetical protein
MLKFADNHLLPEYYLFESYVKQEKMNELWVSTFIQQSLKLILSVFLLYIHVISLLLSALKRH